MTNWVRARFRFFRRTHYLAKQWKKNNDKRWLLHYLVRKKHREKMAAGNPLRARFCEAIDILVNPYSVAPPAGRDLLSGIIRLRPLNKTRVSEIE